MYENLLAPVPTDLWIGGKWRKAADGQRFDVIDPATENVITSVASAGVDDAKAAVDAAQDAFEGWAGRKPRERGEILRKAYEVIMAQAERLAKLITLENGKALNDSRGEVAYAAEFFRWYAEEAVRIDGQLSLAPSGSNRIMVTRRPVGICVLVTPWNFPAAMATRKIGPALAAGCTMILKPASDTPLTALAIGRLLAAAGVPPGVVNVLPGRRSGPIVSAMLHDRRVRKLSFTGSTEVGRILLRECADNIVNTSMELGGNAPFVVFADADLDAALDGAMIAKMRNGGEACTAANRFYVEAPVAAEFSRRLAGRMAALRVGPGTEESTEVGPLVNDEAVDKVQALVTDAVEAGATVVTGGSRPRREGCYYEPTVLTGVRPGSAILREEIFGPVAPIVSFTTEDEAVVLANDTEYGLVAYVYTGDLARGLRVSERIDAGMVGLNRGLVSDPAAPFGGTKQSGIGREGGHEGVLDYTESLYLALSW
jgi:succinate-semialdehyde dehydrogenase / glutarate-semialdehyde dehydrogenase